MAVIKHTFANNIVLQFNCKNTLNDQILSDLNIETEGAYGYDPISYLPVEKLKYGDDQAKAYAVLSLPDEEEVCGTSLACTMRFVALDCDPNTGEADDDEGYPDEYVIDDVEITIGDHIQKILKPNFSAAWEEIGDDLETENTYHLEEIATLEDAVAQIIKFLGMQPCERSDKIPDGKMHHVLLLAGVYRGGHECLVRVRMVLKDGVQIQLSVRGTDPTSVEIISNAIG